MLSMLSLYVTAMRLPAAAPPPAVARASSIYVPRPEAVRALSPFEAVVLAAFRWQTQQQTGCRSDEPGFEGMLEELREYQRGHTVTEQAEASGRIMDALAGPFPQIFRAFSREPWAPAALAWCTTQLLSFLVGGMALTEREAGDARGGGVLVERCAVLEHSGCKGLCVHMCKLPTERMFAERWGLPMRMQPNFETCECQLSFGVRPPPLEEDPTVPAGCLGACPLAQE
eukprot:Transcript_25375.p1 GENE.Transcript_25375~~Transcript_25375.p1  ORF type:complete len:228 (-),score=57.45 Transcript_25375:152-835(-)